jgi:hypothetical protein
MGRCIVISREENTRSQKLPYSTPRLIPYSLGELAALVGKSNVHEGRPVTPHSSGPGIQPPPMLIEGFEGDVEDLITGLSSIGRRSKISSESAARTSETMREKSDGPLEGGICILLVDMRRRFAGSRQPLTRMEVDSDANGTLTLILTDSGEDFVASGEIRRADRWQFRGPIVPEGLAALIKSVFQICATPREQQARPGSTLTMNSSSVSAVACAERE